jgi:hypothetical protein
MNLIVAAETASSDCSVRGNGRPCEVRVLRRIANSLSSHEVNEAVQAAEKQLGFLDHQMQEELTTASLGRLQANHLMRKTSKLNQ